MNPLAKTILEEIEQVCAQVPNQQIEDCLNQLDKTKTIFLDGEGRSGLILRCFAMRLVHLGFKAHVIGEATVPAMDKEDVFIGVSGSGNKSTVWMHLVKAKAFGCNTIVITAKKESVLAKESEHVLLIPGTIKTDHEGERISIQLLSSLFDQSLHVIMDMMALMLSYRQHMTNTEATAKHF